VSVPASYIAVVFIWATTPLAIKWSGEGPGVLLGALGRMSLAALLCLLLSFVLGAGLPWHRQARHTYVAAALGAYGAMLCVYWGSQYIPSGITAILFGLTPFITAILARIFLQENSLTAVRLGSMTLGFAGLLSVFSAGSDIGPGAVKGIVIVLIGVLLHSVSTVWVKRINAALPGMTVAAGGLLLAVPLYLVTWLVLDGKSPAALPERAVLAIVYLSIIGTAVGFTLYYYVLRNMAASGVGLIPLASPVLALLLGKYLNHEQFGTQALQGMALILSALVLYQFDQKIRAWLPIHNRR